MNEYMKKYIKMNNIILQINIRTDALSFLMISFHLSILCLWEDRLSLGHRLEQKNRLSRVRDKEWREKRDRSKIARGRAVARAYRWEKWAKKAHFRGGLSAGDVLLRYIAKGSICSGQSVPFFAPTYTRTRSPHFADVSDIGVTTAFYKVRDFATGMCIRLPYPFYHSRLPLATSYSSLSAFRGIVFAPLDLVPRSQCFSIFARQHRMFS